MEALNIIQGAKEDNMEALNNMETASNMEDPKMKCTHRMGNSLNMDSLM